MDWKRVWNDWKWTAAALGACMGAFMLHRAAWHAGYRSLALSLLGLLFLRILLLLVAWVSVVAVFQAAAGNEPPPHATGFTVLHLVVLVLIVPGCVGCYPAWPVVLLVLAFLFVALMVIRRDALRSAWGPVVLRPGLCILLFLLTWGLSAALTRQAVVGFGAHVDEVGGADRLLGWATDAIAATPRDERRALTPDEVPDFVADLMGPFQGVRSIEVRNVDDPSVLLYTGGSAYHFRITLRPSRVNQDAPPWWVGADSDEARPGVYLEPEGK